MKTVFIRVSFQVEVPDDVDTECLYLDVDPNSVNISEFTPGEDDSKDRDIAFTDLSWETTSTSEVRKVNCKGCCKPLDPANYRIADGCPCNSVRGINHGNVSRKTCTCIECDPEQTGSARQG